MTLPSQPAPPQGGGRPGPHGSGPHDERSLEREPLIDLAAVSELLIRRYPGTQRVTEKTLRGWASRGVLRQGRHDAERVRLEVLFLGGTAYTSEAAVRRFLERINEPLAAGQEIAGGGTRVREDAQAPLSAPPPALRPPGEAERAQESPRELWKPLEPAQRKKK